MRRPSRPFLGALVVVLVIACVLAVWQRPGVAARAVDTGQQSPQVTTFRTSVALVPIDVRVVSKKTGEPVTDLKPEDFTIFEDDVRQQLRHFLLQAFAARTPGPDTIPAGEAGTTLPTRESPLSLTPQASRVFLIVLGNGRLQEPSKGLDAVLQFVRTRLLPHDQVAVFAYNRATDFTTDHEKTAQVLERFRQENDAIAGAIDFQMSGLATVYGSQELPQSVQARIDRVFQGAGALPSSHAGSAQNAQTGDRTRRDARQRVEGALEVVVDAGRVGPETEAGSSGAVPLTDWRSFDTFVEANARTLRDLGNLYAAIAYMRKLDGEKRLVFMTESGMVLGRTEDERDLARVANDARVAIDVIQTGGVIGPLTARAMRSIAEDTGGLASISEYSQSALKRLDAATRSGYLLGYYPLNTNWNGAYRKIVVKVNRPDVTVLFRHGYLANAKLPAFDRREYLTRFRLEAAANHADNIDDIRVKVRASMVATGGQQELAVEVRVDPADVFFTLRDGVRFGRLEIAVIAMDAKRTIIGGTYRRTAAHLEYDQATFEIVKREGIPCQLRIRAPSGTRYVRVVVYDYMKDLIGSAGTWVF